MVVGAGLHRTFLLAGVVLASPATRWVADQLNHQPSLCPLLRVTGVACPSCGGTRAGLFLLSGGLIRPAQLLGVAKSYD